MQAKQSVAMLTDLKGQFASFYPMQGFIPAVPTTCTWGPNHYPSPQIAPPPQWHSYDHRTSPPSITKHAAAPPSCGTGSDSMSEAKDPNQCQTAMCTFVGKATDKQSAKQSRAHHQNSANGPNKGRQYPTGYHITTHGWQFVLGAPYQIRMSFAFADIVPGLGNNIEKSLRESSPAILASLIQSLASQLPAVEQHYGHLLSQRKPGANRFARLEPHPTSASFDVLLFAFYEPAALALQHLPTPTACRSPPANLPPPHREQEAHVPWSFASRLSLNGSTIPFNATLHSTSVALGDLSTPTCFAASGAKACFKPMEVCFVSDCQASAKKQRDADAFMRQRPI